MRVAGRKQRGFLLIVAAVLIAVAAVMTAIIVSLTAGGGRAGGLHLGSTQAFFAAESGLARGIYGFTKEGTSCNSLSYSGTVGTGSFNTNGRLYNPTPASLSAGISASDTVIPVSDVSGYAPFGRVSIEAERIDYAATSTTSCAPFSPPCLIGAQRGVAGTTAAPHAAGRPVTQNLCLITSTGKVASTGAARTVEATIEAGGGIIVLDRAESRGGRANPTLSWRHRVGVGSDRLLVVGVSIRNNPPQTVTAVRYNGIPLTRIGFQDNGNDVRVELWYLVDPPTGNNQVEVWLSPGDVRVVGGSVSFTGVNQANPVDASSFNSGGPNVATVNVTTSVDNAWVIDTVASRSSLSVLGADQDEQWNRGSGGGGNVRVYGGGSTLGPVSPAGSVTLQWSTAFPWAIGAVAIRPGGAGALVGWREAFQ